MLVSNGPRVMWRRSILPTSILHTTLSTTSLNLLTEAVRLCTRFPSFIHVEWSTKVNWNYVMSNDFTEMYADMFLYRLRTNKDTEWSRVMFGGVDDGCYARKFQRWFVASHTSICSHGKGTVISQSCLSWHFRYSSTACITKWFGWINKVNPIFY